MNVNVKVISRLTSNIIHVVLQLQCTSVDLISATTPTLTLKSLQKIAIACIRDMRPVGEVFCEQLAMPLGDVTDVK